MHKHDNFLKRHDDVEHNDKFKCKEQTYSTNKTKWYKTNQKGTKHKGYKVCKESRCNKWGDGTKNNSLQQSILRIHNN